MQFSRRAISSSAVVLSSISAVSGEDNGANPLGAVLTLMDDLSVKVAKDGEAEEKAYHEYFEWCDETTQNAGFAIKTATAEKNKLEASIKEFASEISVAETKIDELADSIATSDKELKDASVIRKKEVADFSASESELVETVDALNRAVGILSKEIAKNPASFAQMDTSNAAKTMDALSVILDAASFSTIDHRRLVAFVQAQQDDGDELSGAPAAAVYKSKAGGIVDVCEDMKEKAEGQLDDLRKGEVKNRHNFEMLKNSLESSLADSQKDLDAEKASKATSEETKATGEKDLDATVKELESTKDQLATARGSCITTAADHEASVAARKEELGVIAKAKQILKESTGGAEKRSYSLLQMTQSSSNGVGLDVVAAVRRIANEQKSKVLAQLASNMNAVVRHQTGGDVFGKVKGMIQAMIGKLEKEADEDAEEKAYCDEQMSKTEAKKSDLEDDIAKMTARIDSAEAKSATLQQELQVLASELSALAKEQAELDKIRAEEHEAYVTAKSDLEQGLQGVRKALGVLQEYYGAGSSMLQEDANQPEKPQSFSKASGAGGSIVDILTVVESDFATGLSKVEAEESNALDDYDKVTQENTVTKVTREKDEEYKTKESKSLGKTAAEYKGDRDGANTELDAVNEYYSKVKDRCIAKPESYEKRTQRRTAEIAGLKDALSILENEVALFQRKRRGLKTSFLSAQ